MKSQPVELLASCTTHSGPVVPCPCVAWRMPVLLGKSPKKPVLVAGQMPVFASNMTEYVWPSEEARIRLPTKDRYCHLSHGAQVPVAAGTHEPGFDEQELVRTIFWTGNA